MVSLESNKLFCELLPAELEQLHGAARELTFAANQPIFRQGDPGDGIYFVKEGLVQIATMVSTGESKELSKIAPGDLFGELAVLDNEPRSASATADKATTVYFISRDELQKLLEHMPRLFSALVREITRRMRTFNDKYVREAFEAERLQLVGRFASSIVHDLKNPLNIIGISAEMACMPSSTLESREVAKVRIRKQVERISNMVSELLEFTQGAHINFILAQMSYNSFVEPLLEEIQQDQARMPHAHSFRAGAHQSATSVTRLSQSDRQRGRFHGWRGRHQTALHCDWTGSCHRVGRHRQRHRAGNPGPSVPGLRHSWQGQRDGLRAFDLQEDHPGPSWQNQRPQCPRRRRALQLYVAAALD